MKPKDRMFPPIGEHYQLQLRQVVSESHPQRRWNPSGADRHFAVRAEVVDPMGDRVCKSTTSRWRATKGKEVGRLDRTAEFATSRH